MRRAERRLAAIAVGALLLLAGTACGGSGGGTTATSSPVQKINGAADEIDATYNFVIPKGTAELLARGATVTFIPSPLEVRVGEIMKITNQDVVGQDIGPIYVGPGETVVQRFASPGTLKGACMVHPSGEIVINISP